MITLSLEARRACNCCGSRTDVLTITLGQERLRVCDNCFIRLVAGRQRLKVEMLDSLELR